MHVYFIGAPTMTEPLEFGFSVLPLYTTMRDGGIALASSFSAGLCTAAISGPWTGLLGGCAIGVVALIATQVLRRRYGYQYLTELGMALGWTRDRPGFLGDSRRARIFSHAWLLGGPDGSDARAHPRAIAPLNGILRFPPAVDVELHAPGSWCIQRGAPGARRRSSGPGPQPDLRR